MQPGRRRLVVTAILALVLALALIPLAPRPSVDGVANAWGPTTREATTVFTTVTVQNPYPVPLTVQDARFELDANGVRIGEGSLADEAGARVPAGGSVPVTLVTVVESERFLPDWWATHVEAGERTTVRVTGTVRAGSGPFTLLVPFEEERSWRTRLLDHVEGALVTCPSSGLEPCIESSDHRWGAVTEDGTRLESVLRVRNPLPLPVPVGDAAFGLRLHGVRVAEGGTDELIVLRPDGTTDVHVESVVDHADLRRWWPRHVDSCEESPASVTFRFVRGVIAVDADLPAVETNFACG